MTVIFVEMYYYLIKISNDVCLEKNLQWEKSICFNIFMNFTAKFCLQTQQVEKVHILLSMIYPWLSIKQCGESWCHYDIYNQCFLVEIDMTWILVKHRLSFLYFLYVAILILIRHSFLTTNIDLDLSWIKVVI